MQGRTAAVAAVVDARLDVLFIRRAASPADPWSGNVALPGGRVDPGDAGPLAAAIRESREELGLDLSDAELLGPLHDIHTAPGLPKMVVRPFVFHVRSFGALQPNYEVASTHVLGVHALLRGEGRSSMPFDFRGHPITLPCVDFDGVRLWGMTLRMIDDLLHRLDGKGVGMARPTMA